MGVLHILQQFDLHHHSQLRHEFGKMLLLLLQQFDLHHHSQLRHEFGRMVLLLLTLSYVSEYLLG